MKNSLPHIKQISLSLKTESSKIHEVACCQPFSFPKPADPSPKWLKKGVLRFPSYKFLHFLFERFPWLISEGRLSPEAKFKTALTLILKEEELRDLYLQQTDKRNSFYRALAKVASQIGYTSFSPPSASESSERALQALTYLPAKKISLYENPKAFNWHLTLLSEKEKNHLLFLFLTELERPSQLSLIELSLETGTIDIPLITHYVQYKIERRDKDSGLLHYSFKPNQATSSICTLENIRPGIKGVVNQQVIRQSDNQEIVGYYSGELNSVDHVLEQILFVLGETDDPVQVSKTPPSQPFHTRKIFFTSLFSWNELSSLHEQHEAIESLHTCYLYTKKNVYLLELLHANFPFNKFPTPAETGAVIRDLNEEALIWLTWEVWKKLGLKSKSLDGIITRLKTIRSLELVSKTLYTHEEEDLFRTLKKELLSQLENLPDSVCVLAVRYLFQKPLKSKEALLWLDLLAHELGYIHTKNSKNGIKRISKAKSLDKAQWAYKKTCLRPFLPTYCTDQEEAFFNSLYRLYQLSEPFEALLF